MTHFQPEETIGATYTNMTSKTSMTSMTSMTITTNMTITMIMMSMKKAMMIMVVRKWER